MVTDRQDRETRKQGRSGDMPNSHGRTGIEVGDRGRVIDGETGGGDEADEMAD